MTDLLHDVDAPSDAELISRVRGGDVAAYGDLFSRHVDAAKRLARQLVRGPDADDLVSDAFAKVLSVLQGGGGPDVAFRAYLLTAVRRLHVDKLRSGARLQTSDDMEAFDAGVPFQDTAVAAFESGAAAKAFASLPERWQLVLWHLEVEGQKPADVAPLLGMSPNSVSALAYRAREGLRQAFLTMHLNDISETDCRWVNEHLGAYVRNGLAKRDSVKVRAHLDDCRRCTAMYLELTEVNSNLAAIIAPLLLGAAATGYVASAGGAAGGLGIGAAFGRIRDVVSANAGVATAGAVAAGVAAVAAAGIMLLPSSSDPDTVVGADRPVETVSTPPAATEGGDKPAGSKQDRKPSSQETTAGPAVLLPSEAPLASDSPGTVTALDPGTTTTGDGTTAGDGSAPGEGAGTPGDQGSAPTEPAPTEPAPSEPAPTEPAPTEPTPTQPAPTEPAPSEPAPSEPAPTEPTPTEPPPTEPPPVTYTLQVNRTSIQDGQVIFDLSGNPLPPTVYLQIESPAAGISFDPLGSGTCVRVSDVLAECTTTPPAPAVLAPLARAVSLALSEPVQISMPFSGAPKQDTEVTLSLQAPLGNELQRATVLYDVPEAPGTADVGLSRFPDKPVEPLGVHDYVVSGQLDVTDYTGDVLVTLSDPDGRARFADSVPGCQRKSNQTVTCPAEPGPLTLPLYVQDNRLADTTVTLTVSRADGEPDSDAGNDSTTIVLARYVPKPVDVAVSASTSERGNSGKADVSVVVTASDSTVPVTLDAAYDPDIAPAPDGCAATSGGATCSFTGSRTLTFSVEIAKIKNEPTAGDLAFAATVPEEYVDTNSDNDSSSVTIARFTEDSTTTGSTSQQRTASDGTSPTADRADQEAGAASTTSPTLHKTTAKVNLLSETRDQPAKKGDAPQKTHEKSSAKSDKGTSDKGTSDRGKHRAVGHDDGSPGSQKNDKASTKKSDKPAKSDAPSQGESGNGGQGNGGQGSSGDNGNGKKDDPGPVARVVSAAAGLLF